MSELKSCPFCGGEAEMCSESKFFGKYWYVRCKTCCSRGPSVCESEKELKSNQEYEAIRGAWGRAIEAWNRRAKKNEDGKTYA